VERFGGLDVVLANAGVAPDLATVSTQPNETFERVIDVDLLGVYRTVDAALPQIIARQGQVVVVSSLYAFINGMGAAAYAMSKAAVEQFGRALRVELSQHGASASVVYFGFVDTDMARTAFDADALAQRLVATPLPRMLLKRVPPERAAEIVLRGIEARRPSIFCPRSRAALAYLRGLVGPLSDARLAGEDAVQQVMVELERR
jgi:NAD(P)-dependent dehydrogenase (short-subunit alcohol dehydrogenase family)